MTETRANSWKNPEYYLFNSRLLTHILFWVTYYISFSLIWVNELGLVASFFLEFILLPARMLAVYVMIYWLMPEYLFHRRFAQFLALYLGLLLLCAFTQRLFIYFFYEGLLVGEGAGLYSMSSLFRAALLINTTVVLAAFIKLLGGYLRLLSEVKSTPENTVRIKANRRTYLVEPRNIVYLEGLGNYIKYTLEDGQKLTAYCSLKQAHAELPSEFIRVHKSYVVNKHFISSFSAEDIQIGTESVPRGKSVADADLVI